eukprot:639584-Rhodomonas_salina.1
MAGVLRLCTSRKGHSAFCACLTPSHGGPSDRTGERILGTGNAGTCPAGFLEVSSQTLLASETDLAVALGSGVARNAVLGFVCKVEDSVSPWATSQLEDPILHVPERAIHLRDSTCIPIFTIQTRWADLTLIHLRVNDVFPFWQAASAVLGIV